MRKPSAMLSAGDPGARRALRLRWSRRDWPRRHQRERGEDPLPHVVTVETKGTHHARLQLVKPFRWGPQKNEQLKLERGVSFEQMVVAVEAGGLLDVLAHPNQKTYPNQRVLVVASDGCACLVPFVEQADHFFLKTVMPSRKATRDYLGQGEQDAED